MDDELVTVATFNTTTRAEAARQRLEADGIKAMILDHETTPASPSAFALAATLGGVKLLVRAEDEDRAVNMLDRFARLPTEAIATAETPDSSSTDAVTTEENREALSGEAGEAPEGGEENEINVQTTDREHMAGRVLRAQFLSFIFWPLQLVTFVLILQVAFSKQRLSDKPLKSFSMAVALHISLWLFFFFMWMMLRS